MSEGKVANKITEDEAKVYDRQIRLWGLDAQKRLRGASVLIVGMGGLGAEVAKNIILVGVQSVHLMDVHETTKDDLQSQFFLRRENLKGNRALNSQKLSQLLNPMVKVSAENCPITSKPPEFFQNYDVVCLLDHDWSTAIQIDRSCRKYGSKLLIGSAFGLYAYAFSDLGKHEYAVDVPEKKEKIEKRSSDDEPQTKKMKIEEDNHKTVKKRIDFSALEDVLNYDWSKADQSRVKKTPDGFFLSKLISDFVHHSKRLPLSPDQDLLSLTIALSKVTKEMAIPQDKIPLEMLEECYKQLSPVCAVMGALIAQEVIKVVSKKDHPHNNFLFFDGRTGVTFVDQIGL